MWGYPEFYIPVPGGYGTGAHGHLLSRAHRHPVLVEEAEPDSREAARAEATAA